MIQVRNWYKNYLLQHTKHVSHSQACKHNHHVTWGLGMRMTEHTEWKVKLTDEVIIDS